MKNRLLYRIKQDIFRGLGEYSKCFPDFDIWQLSKPFIHKENSSQIWEAARDSLKASENFLIYIHLPFCFAQCRFCNAFPFKPNKSQQELYVKYLVREAELFSKLGIFDDKKVSCVYLGGGTPTGMGVENLQRILHRIRGLFAFKENCDVTCETHPVRMIGKSGLKNIKLLKEAGVNRVSMGAQTFDKAVLNYCHRCHTVGDVEKALNNLKEFQMRNNVDMMTGLPGQTVRSLKNDLLKLEKLNPDAVEYMRHDVVNDKVIKLYRKNPTLFINKDVLFEMNLLCQKWMERQGYEQNGSFSENSQFFPYRYDWVMGKPYLGLGSGAVSHFGGVRFVKLGNLSLYFSSLERNIMPIWNFRVFSNLEQAYRTLLLRLQTKAGITTKELKDRFGAGNYNAINLTINKLKDYELIIDNGGVVRLTDSYGRYFVEDICDLIMDESRRILGIRI